MPPAGALVGHESVTRCHPPRVKTTNRRGDGKTNFQGIRLASPLPVCGVPTEIRRVTIVRC